MLDTTPLHPRYGRRVHDVQLAEITAEQGYPEIRRAFEEHSLLHFPDQLLDDAGHLRLGALFGPREDRSLRPDQPDPAVSLVSNVREDGRVYREGDRRLLDLQSNMLWHTDSTFLPVPALANILVGRVVPPSGTATEFTSSRIAWEEMPEALKDRARNRYFRHDYTYSRRKVDAALAEEEKFAHWGQQVWKSVWTNPVNGREALYIASHACDVVGMPDRAAALALIDELTRWCTRKQYVYTHQWKEGDVLIWDERAVLHRGVPWNYRDARTLSSICISATSEDGLDEMRYSPNERERWKPESGSGPSITRQT